MVPAMDLFDNSVGVGGPDERFGFTVVLTEMAVDRGLQVDQRMEHAALQAPAGQGGKKAFDRIGPGARGRGEMKGPARMAAEPLSDLGVLVDGVVVEDRMDELASRDSGLDAVQKTDEFPMAVARHALADDRAVENIECREQRGCAPGAGVVSRKIGVRVRGCGRLSRWCSSVCCCERRRSSSR